MDIRSYIKCPQDLCEGHIEPISTRNERLRQKIEAWQSDTQGDQIEGEEMALGNGKMEWDNVLIAFIVALGAATLVVALSIAVSMSMAGTHKVELQRTNNNKVVRIHKVEACKALTVESDRALCQVQTNQADQND